MATKSSKTDAVRKALRALDINLLDLSFVQRDSLSARQTVTIHEVDRTPKVFDPDLGPGDGLREKCFDANGLDVGGKGATGNAGKMTWKLSNFVCVEYSVSEPASFVATARSDSPVFLTSRTVATGDDLVIDVFSWDVSGNPAPNVGFAWRCWTEGGFSIGE